MKKENCLLIIGCIIISIFFISALNMHSNEEVPSTINSAKQLRINTNQTVKEWDENNFVYMDDPVGSLEKFASRIDEIAYNPEEAENDKRRLFKYD